ncbi:MAG: bifunctional folylpolyglutamate synthase/dihydrofolate synthase, partial [Thermodesulfovibrio sp.]|nr:bifunctional folylpolyglutamate synthase/dihydrofolate synthase [Thermodesulfovibrio sp.]
ELYSRRTKGIKLGLERIFAVLEKFHNPQNSFPTVHIAGTNGKGSVSKIIYSLLKAHGLKVGLFTSPHLTRFTERIIVNEMEISEEDVIRLIEKIKPYSDELTFFEYITVMAFLYFQEKKVDYAVLETGMGGRLDATNVVKPEISVITSIGLDHQEFLGYDLFSIAREKAGIIKEGVPVVSSSQEKEAEEVIIKKAEEKGSALFIYGRDFAAELKSISLDGIVFDFYPSSLYTSNSKSSALSLKSDLHLSLTGLHQMENASVALKAFITIYPYWDEFTIRETLKKIKMPGRLEVISKEPIVILDIAHNPQAASYLVKSLKRLTEKKPVVVFGVMKDKDVEGILKQFEGYAEKIFFTSPRYERALRFEELVKRLNGYSKNIQAIPDVPIALKEGLCMCEKNSELFLLCTGSAYLIGEIKEALGEKSSLRNLGELI